MSSRLIVLTGSYRLLHNVLSRSWAEYDSVLYYPSIRDELLRRDDEGHWRSCPYFRDLLMCREINRDREILALLNNSDRTVLVEQWHIGNLAWSSFGDSGDTAIYEERLNDILHAFKPISIHVWFVSDDLEKVAPGAEGNAYRIYLQSLSDLVKRLGLRTENIDGEALPEFIVRRVSYLLTLS